MKKKKKQRNTKKRKLAVTKAFKKCLNQKTTEIDADYIKYLILRWFDEFHAKLFTSLVVNSS